MKHFAFLPCVLLVASCSAFWDPSGAIVDMKGIDREQFEIDLADCERYSDEVRVGKHIATGAAGGAAVGAAVGAVSGANKSGIGKSAGIGAVYGGTVTGMSAVRDHRYVLRECLRGRGYRVLN